MENRICKIFIPITGREVKRGYEIQEKSIYDYFIYDVIYCDGSRECSNNSENKCENSTKKLTKKAQHKLYESTIKSYSKSMKKGAKKWNEDAGLNTYFAYVDIDKNGTD